jgi:hypothetical protein
MINHNRRSPSPRLIVSKIARRSQVAMRSRSAAIWSLNLEFKPQRYEAVEALSDEAQEP